MSIQKMTTEQRYREYLERLLPYLKRLDIDSEARYIGIEIEAYLTEALEKGCKEVDDES